MLVEHGALAMHGENSGLSHLNLQCLLPDRFPAVSNTDVRRFVMILPLSSSTLLLGVPDLASHVPSTQKIDQTGLRLCTIVTEGLSSSSDELLLG